MTIRPTDAWTRTEKDAAKAILLESSPYETDGGELIGRDPRRIPAEDFARSGLEGNPILKVIKAKCVDCCGGREFEVRKCVLITCPNWPYRMGANPFRKSDVTDEERARRIEHGRALAARRHGGGPELIKLTSENSTGKSDDPSGPKTVRLPAPPLREQP